MRAKDEIKMLQAKLDSGAIGPEEPLFTLRAQDRLAPDVVRVWAMLAGVAGTPQEKRSEALSLADSMAAWPNRKTPD